MVNFNAFSEKPCAWCGEDFNVKEVSEGSIPGNGRKYCSDECRENAAYCARINGQEVGKYKRKNSRKKKLREPKS